MLPFPFLIEEGKMKLGELKLEALMLIYPADELKCNIDDSDELCDKIAELASDSGYYDYLVAMPGAINRCFAELEGRGLVPKKSYTVKDGDKEQVGTRVKVDLSKIESLLRVERVLFYGDFSDIREIEHSYLGDKELLLPKMDGTYVIIYTPVTNRVYHYSVDSDEVHLPEDVCALIPYFVKSELLRAENEKEAAVARNTFEVMLDALSRKDVGYQTKVQSIYEVPL